MIRHIVQPGETLWSIAARYGLSVEAIMEANRLRDPNQFDVGQVLLVPVAPFSPAQQLPVAPFLPVQQQLPLPRIFNLERRVTRLEREINRLDRRIDRLEDRVRRLEQRR